MQMIDVKQGWDPLRGCAWYATSLDAHDVVRRFVAIKRSDCAHAHWLARKRADAQAAAAGPGFIVNDGTDRGSGILWDLRAA